MSATTQAARGRVAAWRELLRVANVFTAISNVLAGYLITTGGWPHGGLALPCLVAASALIYAAGMVLNDAFDAELDRIERPERPIPTGRVGRRAAFVAGWLLLAGGVAMAVVVSGLAANGAPAVVASCLAITVVLYDGGLKSTWAGPWAMGWCRTLNVLLGASGSPRMTEFGPVWLYAAGVGAYTVALTYLAKRETGDDVERALRIRGWVQRMIVGFIVIDAVAATVAAGWPSGLAVLALLAPTLLLARRTAMT